MLEATPSNREASRIAQQAEAELVIEDCLGKARAALRAGDRDRALDEVRRGFMVRKNDARLLALHREACSSSGFCARIDAARPPRTPPRDRGESPDGLRHR